MNCREAERRILLRHSGELLFQQGLQLEQHLVECERCRAYHNDLERILPLAKNALRSGTPGEPTRAAIRDAAAADAGRRDRTRLTRLPPAIPAWRPLLALAAAALVALGGWLFLARQSASTGGPATARQTALPADNADDFTVAAQEFMALTAEDVVCLDRLADLADQQQFSPLELELLLIEGLAI